MDKKGASGCLLQQVENSIEFYSSNKRIKTNRDCQGKRSWESDFVCSTNTGNNIPYDYTDNTILTLQWNQSTVHLPIVATSRRTE